MREQICKMNPEKRGHDACGIGAVVDRWGRPSRQTVEDALEIVEHLEHRAGKDASGQTGDGVGILLQICHPFFVAAAKEVGVDLAQAAPRGYGVGMFFFPQDPLRRGRCQKLLEILAQREGVDLLGWRPVPVAPEILGQRARSCMPAIWQGFFRRPEEAAGDLDFDRRLYVLRRTFEQSVSDTYVASLSCRTIVYKGMFLVDQLRRFYPDLRDARYTSAIALVHSRFSTNTEPSWARAHPNRVLLHNGEINTIQGNLSRMLAREETMASPLLAAHREKVLPVLDPSGSDSAMLDNTLEFLLFHGLDLPKAVMVTLPEPWSRNGEMPRAIRDMYHYYATMMEPWDGPAALLFSDGDLVGACLDRNGLRPLRYYELSDGRVVLASEVGVLDLSPSQVVCKARLGPGQMLVVDTRTGTLAGDRSLKEVYAAQHPYGEWLDRELHTLDKLPVPNHRVARHDQATRDKLYTVFGYTYEDVVGAILPMAQQGEEPILSMGADVPIAALAQLFLRCDKACQGGANLLILSDRGVDENHVAIPSLLAVAALEQHLIQTRKRTAVSVILESGEPRDVHQVAALLGYGARAVNPYLAHECIAELIDKGLLDKDFYAAVADYDRAILAGVVSVAAKMGISSLQSYQSAQCFEAVGLDGDLMARFFPNTPCQVGGVGLDAIEAAVTASHDRAFDPMDLSTDPAIDSGGIQKLRSRVKLEVDGKLMTGRDVAVACALGAEEFGFATAPLVALGCLMLRACNLDTCAAGIATQDPALRQGFRGKAEFVMAFMTYLAQEVREILAWLGLHSLEELVGRRDLLRVGETPGGPDVSPLLAPAQAPEGSPTRFCPKNRYPFHLEDTLDHRLLLPLLEGKALGVVDLTCRDRAFGTMLGSEVTRRFGDSLPEDTYRVACRGGAGQSFGAFLPAGVTLELQGDANDYFGKGLSGGKLIAYPPADSALTPGDQVIVGNVALYGATGGKAFLRGTAGERFCVRNSGALAVVEGVGDHGCEYMTGGRVAVIGPTGRNFAAGMSGGVVYVLDRDHDFYRRVNKDLVSVEPLEDPEDIQELREMIAQHWEATGSPPGPGDPGAVCGVCGGL